MRKTIMKLDTEIVRDWRYWGFAFAIVPKGIELVIPGFRARLHFLP